MKLRYYKNQLNLAAQHLYDANLDGSVRGYVPDLATMTVDMIKGKIIRAMADSAQKRLVYDEYMNLVFIFNHDVHSKSSFCRISLNLDYVDGTPRYSNEVYGDYIEEDLDLRPVSCDFGECILSLPVLPETPGNLCVYTIKLDKEDM